MKKIFTTLLMCTLLFLGTNVNYTSAMPNNSNFIAENANIPINNNEMSVINMGHGEFKVSSTNSQADPSGNVKIKKINDNLYQIEDTNLLAEDKEYDKLLKVNESSFLSVKTLKVNLLNAKELDQVIKNYDINPEMAKDLRNLADKAAITEGMPSEINIYTPKKQTSTTNSGKMSIASTSSRISTNYYSGYAGYNYCDEVWEFTQTTEMLKVKNGTATKSYITSTISDVGEFLLDEVIDKYYGTQYVVLKLFFPSISDFTPYPANYDDFWQASLIEDKYRKYTSIEIWDSSSNSYVYVTRAIGSIDYVKFNHYVYFQALMSSGTYKTDPLQVYYTPNYYNLDYKAYQYMYDLPYNEDFRYWSPNEYTKFSSI
ncbi:hypothetical protein ACHOLT_18690 [Desulfitobacterium sp. Sab5]|uniref:hypothetical protein n=1 Tax=Desulfitobacterium nosdiversum TaxID=3375356 RepID=UPI003CE8C2AC